MEELGRRGPAPALFVRAARELTAATAADIGSFAGVGRRAVHHAQRPGLPDVRLVQRVLGDARFPGLVSGDPRLRDRLRARTDVHG